MRGSTCLLIESFVEIYDKTHSAYTSFVSSFHYLFCPSREEGMKRDVQPSELDLWLVVWLKMIKMT